MPKIDIAKLQSLRRTRYPGDLRKVTKGYQRVAMGDAAGLTQFGVNRAVLAPGAATSLRHWHENEDEFVIVLEGEVVLVDDNGETPMHACDCAGFRAGDANGHTIINRSERPAILFEIGTRLADEIGHYPDVDLLYKKIAGEIHFTRRDGTAISET